jgi:hypothetical protein
MTKTKFLHIAEWSIAFAACVYLVCKLVMYEDYAALGETLCAMSRPQWLAVILSIALMPLNMTLEAWRWRTLLPMSRREAHRQVYYSKLAGLITPWRLGEYPARGLMEVQKDEGQNTKEVMANVLIMGTVGSATMTAAIVLAGVIALVFSPSVLAYLGGRYLYSLAAAVVILGGVYFLFPRAMKKYASVNSGLLFRSTAQSLVRLACWCVQLGLVLYALSPANGMGIPSEWMANIPIYYLLVTITPNVPIVEVGTRGAWAILLFGSMNAAMAGVLLWGINTLLPCLIWPFLRKNKK